MAFSVRSPGLRLLPGLLNDLNKFRDHFMQIADDTVVGYVKDRGRRIRVDGDNDLRIFHADNMGNCARNAAGKIEFRSNGFAGGSNLIIFGNPAFFYGTAGSGNISAEEAGQFTELVKAFSAADAAASGNKNRSFLNV